MEKVIEEKRTYRFGVASFNILNTRSRHEDTVYVTVSLAIGKNPPLSKTIRLGDLNNGTYSPNIFLDNIQMGGNDTAVLTYAIINNGHSDADTVQTILQKTLSTLASKGAEVATTAIGAEVGAIVGAQIGTAIVPVIGSALGALAGWLVSTSIGLIFANCDGPVAAGFHVFTASQLASQLKKKWNLPFNPPVCAGTDDHQGIDSPHGCGSNSHYTVTWYVSDITKKTAL
jgi:hypothetical protein